MFTPHIRKDPEAIVAAVKLHLVWGVGFLILVYTTPRWIVAVVFLVWLVATVRASLKFLERREQMSLRPDSRIHAFPQSQRQRRVVFAWDIFFTGLFFVPIMIVLLQFRASGEGAEGLWLICIFFFLSPLCVISLIHHLTMIFARWSKTRHGGSAR